MNLLAVYDGCLLTAALVSITGWVGYETCCRPELRGSGPRWQLLPGRCLRLLSAGATLQAAIVLGGAAGRYGDSRAVGAPVLHAAVEPLVWLTIFRLSAAGAARGTREFLARRRRADAMPV